MITRILPPAEWHRLVGTEAESIVPGLDPVDTRVLVVEADGEIVGTWVLLRMVHAECVWIAPAHRKRASVAVRLLTGMGDLARAWGVRSVWTGALTPDVMALIDRIGGVPIPGQHYAIPVAEKE